MKFIKKNYLGKQSFDTKTQNNNQYQPINYIYTPKKSNKNIYTKIFSLILKMQKKFSSSLYFEHFFPISFFIHLCKRFIHKVYLHSPNFEANSLMEVKNFVIFKHFNILISIFISSHNFFVLP